MGVDWYTCSSCERTFTDCGHYGHCAGCENMLCGHCFDKFVTKYGDSETFDYGTCCRKCDDCSNTVPSDFRLLSFALTLLCKTREELIAELRLAEPETADDDEEDDEDDEDEDKED